MIDLGIVVAFAGLLVAAVLVSRSVALVAISVTLGFGLMGNIVQTTTALGFGWTARTLQAAGLGVALVVFLVAGARRRDRSLRFPLLVTAAPAGVIALFLTLMRLLAAGDPAPMSAVGYLINHPLAEDNAKWLHLGAQLADGREIVFNGYAGGPLLLLMAMVAALAAFCSTVLLGGVNEVAVAANAVVMTQFLLIALVPFALAPFAERRVRLRGVSRWAPGPAILAGAFVLFVASAVVTSYGHLSLQWTLLVLTLWIAAFALEMPFAPRFAMTLAIICTVSVWVPINVLGDILAVAVLVWAIRARRRGWVAVAVLTVIACLDALVSSTFILIGVQLGAGDLAALLFDRAAVAGTPSDFSGALSLFTAPGAVEQVAPILAIIAAASVLGAAWIRRNAMGWSLAPIGILAGYLVLIELLDAVMTGAAPHYGGHKLAFAIVVASLAATLPVVLTALGPMPRWRMNAMAWAAVGAVVFLLAVDTILPRAVSALSPKLWPSVDASAPAYWSVAEVKRTGSQPISSLPVACLVAPPDSQVPTALPLGQESYACTRLLIGLNGLEGNAAGVESWLQRDWLTNSPQWDIVAPSLAKADWLQNRTIALMTPERGTAGVTTLSALIASNPVAKE